MPLLWCGQDPNKANYLVKDEIMKYIYFGGVRIEDNVVVTEHGAEVRGLLRVAEVARSMNSQHVQVLSNQM